ncbi:hypothetical protein FRX31_009370 [Thalictrum thalictroides]|uniref:Uncharacterized protein n=1 Tax=Thalictrum thalictroides TaxID=46969 RepID=A0A7J6WY38_THATH|nr:hypothetical protein FRX31_009370 [Thalictrum thalictroides]
MALSGGVKTLQFEGMGNSSINHMCIMYAGLGRGLKHICSLLADIQDKYGGLSYKQLRKQDN